MTSSDSEKVLFALGYIRVHSLNGDKIPQGFDSTNFSSPIIEVELCSNQDCTKSHYTSTDPKVKEVFARASHTRLFCWRFKPDD